MPGSILMECGKKIGSIFDHSLMMGISSHMAIEAMVFLVTMPCILAIDKHPWELTESLKEELRFFFVKIMIFIYLVDFRHTGEIFEYVFTLMLRRNKTNTIVIVVFYYFAHGFDLNAFCIPHIYTGEVHF
jgi:hypothetical protein